MDMGRGEERVRCMERVTWKLTFSSVQLSLSVVSDSLWPHELQLSDGKESACSAGDQGLIPGLAISPEEGNGYPVKYSCLENYMDKGAWRATVYGIPNSQTRLSNLTHTHIYMWKNYPNWVGKYIHYLSKLPLCVCEFGENISSWGMVFLKRH